MDAAATLDQVEVENPLCAAPEANDLVADDCQRQTWASIRTGLEFWSAASA